MAYRFTMDAAEMSVDEVWGMLRETYWSPRIRREIVEKGMRNSIVIGAIEEASGRQVSYARVVSDCCTFAWLCDVIVHPDHRGRGLSTGMLDRLFAHPDLQGLRRWMLGTRDAHRLYERYGFVQISPERWMEMRSDPTVWQEAT